jgi:hypothetical protein
VDGSIIAAAPAEGLRTSLEKAGVALKSIAPNDNPVRVCLQCLLRWGEWVGGWSAIRERTEKLQCISTYSFVRSSL